MELDKTRNCLKCGIELVSWQIKNYKHYCSLGCKKGKTFLYKNCSNCGEQIKTHLPNKKFCSKLCQQQHGKKETEISFKSEYSIFHRDNFKCIYCGKSSIEDGIKLHIEHIVCIANDGLTEINNLITSCEPCNLSKSTSELSDEVKNRILNVLIDRNKNLSKNQMNDILFQIKTLQKIHDLRANTISLNRAK